MEHKLPLQLVSRHDVIRTIREIEAVQNYYTQAEIRQDKQIAMPALSQLLQSIISENKLDLTKNESRTTIASMLAYLRDNAPVVHVSFAVEPSAQVTQKVLFWFRHNVSPMMLMQTGIQPSIAAGCVVRTTNMYFDFSLRQHLLRNSNILLDKLRSLV